MKVRANVETRSRSSLSNDRKQQTSLHRRRSSFSTNRERVCWWWRGDRSRIPSLVMKPNNDESSCIQQCEPNKRGHDRSGWIWRLSKTAGIIHLFSLAVIKNQFKAARLLLKSGANVNAPGPEGQTPLVDAVLNNNTKVRWSIRSCIVESCLVG